METIYVGEREAVRQGMERKKQLLKFIQKKREPVFKDVLREVSLSLELYHVHRSFPAQTSLFSEEPNNLGLNKRRRKG